MRQLDLGCANRRLPGYIGIDRQFYYYRDDAFIERDLNHGLPFDDNSVDAIFASHLLEHLPDLVFVMEECWRVLKSGALLTVIVPLFPSAGAMKDPTHVRYFVPQSFDYFDLAWNYPGRTEVTESAKFHVKMEQRGEPDYLELLVHLTKP